MGGGVRGVVGMVVWMVWCCVCYVVDSVIVFFMRRKYKHLDTTFEHLTSRGPHSPFPPLTSEEAAILCTPATVLAQQIRDGHWTSEQIVSVYLSYIAQVNTYLHAVVVGGSHVLPNGLTMHEAALNAARAADQRVAMAREGKETHTLPPLLGVPITVKEAFAVRGLPHTSGLRLRGTRLATSDADAVTEMKKAGAIILGLTNTSELCMWYESDNPVYGRTHNPYCIGRIVGGSSGGEGAIIAAGGSALGIGSDVGGSIRLPSFFNGIFGHKPTALLVSNSGQYPDAEDSAVLMLSTGPMCRYAVDLMPTLRIMSGDILNSDRCISPLHASGTDHCCIPASVACGRPEDVRLDRLTIYLPKFPSFGLTNAASAPINDAIDRAAEYMRSLGARVTHVDVDELNSSFEMWSALLHVAKQPSFAMRMGSEHGRSEAVNAFRELLKYCVGSSSHTLPAIGLALFERVPDFTPSLNKFYIDECTKVRNLFTELLCPPSLRAGFITNSNGVTDDRHVKPTLSDGEGCGVIFFPTFPYSAPHHVTPILRPFDCAYSSLVNALHFPATHVPMGLHDGLPIGFQVIGGPAMDSVTIAVAMELERRFGGWVSPPIMGPISNNKTPTQS